MAHFHCFAADNRRGGSLCRVAFSTFGVYSVKYSRSRIHFRTFARVLAVTTFTSVSHLSFSMQKS